MTQVQESKIKFSDVSSDVLPEFGMRWLSKEQAAKLKEADKNCTCTCPLCEAGVPFAKGSDC